MPIPEPPYWGVREPEIDLDEVFPHLDRHVLFKLHWGGRGVKGEAWERLPSTCRRPRAWPSGCTPRCAARELGIPLDHGRRYSWGYPACPDQSEHEKV